MLAEIFGTSLPTLRHTFTTHGVAQETSLQAVQSVLGYVDLKKTSVHMDQINR
jgi:site-specific recombinase XerD